MLFLILIVALVSGCTAQPFDSGAVTIAIEQPPLNFDPRVATDVTSQRLFMLMFSALVKKNSQSSVDPGLALRWDIPDPQTYMPGRAFPPVRTPRSQAALGTEKPPSNLR